MTRLYLTVEGQTEQAFARNLLEPFLAERGVYLLGIQLAVHGRKKGKDHVGGMGRYEPFKNGLCRWLKTYQDRDVRFSTMLDLYRFPKGIPDYDSASKLSVPYDRVVTLERALAKDLGDRRFIPYIQLHEFEVLLLSDPSAFACRYREHQREIDRLEKLVAGYDTPEKINDGEQTAPSKRIGKEIPEYLDAKRTAGSIIAAEIGLEKIRAKCPHFNDWLTKLEGLANAG